MKRLYLIGGAMGVGKTAACRELQNRLERSVFLDGDWCWDMRPFQVTAETKRMVMDNICCLLNNFLRCSAFDHVIFCWVMHRQEIMDELLSRLDTRSCAVYPISLVCTAAALGARLEGDIRTGRRAPDAAERSLGYLPLYGALDTEKIDVSALSPAETAEEIMRRAGV